MVSSESFIFCYSFDCSPSSGEFSGNNIRLGSRGDSYYEYLIKVWLQHRDRNYTYLYDMYAEAMKGVKHLLVQKSTPNGLVFVGELPFGFGAELSPKMDHLVCISQLFSASILFSEKYIRVAAYMLVFGNLKHSANIYTRNILYAVRIKYMDKAIDSRN